MTAEVRIEHTYPAALTFLRLHGPDAVAVLHDLLAHAEQRGDEVVVQASARQVAQRLGFTSKDTVNLRPPSSGPGGRFGLNLADPSFGPDQNTRCLVQLRPLSGPRTCLTAAAHARG